MIVDDDVKNIFALSSVLGKKEMEITFAEKGKESYKNWKRIQNLIWY